MTQQHQPAVLQPGSMLPPSGWPMAGLPVMQPQDPEAAARARWAEAQGENEAAPEAAEAVEGSNQPEDHHAQHGGGKSSTDGHSKVKRPPGTQQCPRCNSKNTKFCYYNNYNVKQPRYYCRDCQRYWTAGGTLRQLAPGAGRRKAKPTAAGKSEQVEPPQKDAHQKQHNNWEQQPQSGEATPQLARAGSAAAQPSPQDNIAALDTAAAAAAAAAAADVLFSSGGSDLLSPASGMQLNPMQLPDGFLPNPLPGKGMQGQHALAGTQPQQQQPQQQAGMLAASGGFGTGQQLTSQNPMSRMLSMGPIGFEPMPQQHQQGQFQPPSQQHPFGGNQLGQFQQLLDPAVAAAAGIPPHVAAATLAAAAAAGLGGPFGSAALMQAQQQWQNAATAAAAAALDPYRNLGALAAMATAATGQPGPMGHYFMAAAAAAAAAAASGMMPGGIDMAAAAMAAALGLSGVYPQHAQVQQQQLMAAAAAAAGGFMPGLDGMGALFSQQPTNTQSQQTQPGQQFMQQQMQHLQQAQQMQQMAAYQQQQMQQAMMAGAPAALSQGLPQQPTSLPMPAMAAVNSTGAQLAPADLMPPPAPQAAAAAATAAAEPAGGAVQQQQQQRVKVEHEDAKKLMPPPPPLHPQQQPGQVRAAGEAVPDGTADDGRRVRQRTASADGQAAATAAAAGTGDAPAGSTAGLPAGTDIGQQQQEVAASSQPEFRAAPAAEQVTAPAAGAGQIGADTPAAMSAPAVEHPLPAAAEAAAAAAAPEPTAAGPQDMAVDASAPAAAAAAAAAAADGGPLAGSAPPGSAAGAATAMVPKQVTSVAQQQQQQAVPQGDVWGAAAQAGLPPLPLPAPSLPLQQQPSMQQQAAFWQNQMQQQYQQHLQQQQLLHFQQQLQFQSQLQQQQNQNHLQGLLQHMQGQLQQQKQVPPELMIMAQHMQQQLAGMGMLQNALTAGSRPGVGGGSSAAGLPPGLNDACNAAALGLLPPDWVQQQMMPGGFNMPPAGVGGLMPPSGIPLYGGAGPDAPGQAVKQQQQLQQAAAQLAAASAALTGGGPVAAAQIAAALQVQQQQGQQLGPPGNTPQSAQNPAPGTAHNANTNPPQNGMASSRWPEGSDAAAAAAAAGFWPGLGGLPPAPSGFDTGAASGRLPGLTGLGMSGMTPMAGLSAGQGQSGGMGVGMGAQLGQEPAMQVATAPSVGGGDMGVNGGEGAG